MDTMTYQWDDELEGEPEPGLLTAREVANILRVNPTTVHRLLKSSELEGFKISNRWRIKRADLERYLELREAVTQTELAMERNESWGEE